MPRTTARRYIKDRTWLRQVWQNDRGIFAGISQTEQRCLHNFYAPADDLANADALKRRRAVTLLQPSLPQRAGRALKALQHEVAAVERYQRENLRIGKKLDNQLPITGPKPKRRRVSARNIVVRPLLRPKPDLKRLVRLLVELARSTEAEDRIRDGDSVPAPTASVIQRRSVVVPVGRRQRSNRGGDRSS